jgi:hypothetical protein
LAGGWTKISEIIGVKTGCYDGVHEAFTAIKGYDKNKSRSDYATLKEISNRIWR